MKKGNWKLNWLALLAVVTGMSLMPVISSAQDESHVKKADDVMVESDAAADVSSTNEVGSAGDKRWEQRAKFKDSLDSFREGHRLQPMVVVRHDAELRTNQTTEAMVVIGGSATVRGKVREAVVAIGGDVTLEGAEVGDEVVAVFGKVKVGKGSKIHGDVVAVGGTVEVADDAVVEGEVHPVDFEMIGLPNLDWVKKWIYQCVLKLRPLAPTVAWVWYVFFAFFLFYLLLAVVIPRPTQACVDELTRRPATTFFMAILTMLLVPVVLIVLTATGIGVLVIPFLLAALFFGALVGKVAFLQYLGFSLGKLFGGSNLKPLLALVIGTVLIALLYMIPILGLVVFAVAALWGFGAAVTASFGSLRRETDRNRANGTPQPPAAPVATATPQPEFASSSFEAPPANAPAMPSSAGEGFFAGTTPLPLPAAMPSPGESSLLPRAGFWERLGAALLDLVICGVFMGICGGPPLGFVAMLAYFCGMWVWKATTVGGLVANLKVVRLDDRPLTWPVALVRGLGAALSASVCFLGFLWVFFDKDRQSWHDKLAGTVVVSVPRGRSLV